MGTEVLIPCSPESISPLYSSGPLLVAFLLSLSPSLLVLIFVEPNKSFHAPSSPPRALTQWSASSTSSLHQSLTFTPSHVRPSPCTSFTHWCSYSSNLQTRSWRISIAPVTTRGSSDTRTKLH